MKTIFTLILIFLFQLSLSAQSGASRIMHRIQDTTINKFGQYYGKSTEGNFSVLLPIPFNDFTLKSEEVITYAIGSKSQEGIKFSVLEIVKDEKTKIVDLDAMLKNAYEPTITFENIKKEKTNNRESISYTVSDNSMGAIIKYINAEKSFFTMIIEFPIQYRKMVEENFTYFFDSLYISN